ncbi:restriction endonuclease subunit S [Campylobacter upsaliensis]
MKALNNNTHPLESLLKQHCPNGVEFKELQEICKLQAGDRIIKSMMNDKAKYPVMGGGTEPTGYYHDYNFNQAITIARAGSAGYVAWQEGKFWATDVCFVAILPISHCETSARKSRQSTNTKSKQMDCHEFDKSNSRNDKAILKFVFYVLKANEYELKKHLYGGSMPKLDKNYLWSFPIPLPPLEIQQKIVDILDAFTELQAELQAELHARRKQYEYYRNKLLSFEELQRRTDMLNGGGLKLVTLGELGKRNAGTKITANQMQALHKENAPIRIFAGGSTIADVDYRDLPKKDVIDKPSIICKARGYIGFEYYDKPFSHKSEFWSYTIEKNANQKFIYYFLVNQQEYFQQIAKANSVKIPQLKVKNTDNFQIPLPPLAVQNDIVELLDKFDTLANDLTSGIPAEIDARKKQYEYYRERLLSFIAKD